MPENYEGFIIIGLILIVLGFVLIMFPFVSRLIPTIGKLPPIIWWTYRTDNFYFATSPILIIISVVSILLFILQRFLR
ncbi:hypothetical protein KEJ51_05040 [Candidatus Bathyarchaeota archaeon]|nr:hypothetical protein [Candidatus Bathyarchaeota archaeon]MBS7629438.1 hypothetical protein [Candidatus Bathyarchaeota archaeon]